MPHGLRVKYDILISLDGKVPGSSHNFAKVKNNNAEGGTLKYIFNGSYAVEL